MTNLNTMTERSPQLIGAFTFYEYGTPNWVNTEIITEEFLGSIFNDKTFTRSNGSIVSRIYERLTKASRRRSNTQSADYFGMGKMAEPAYRQGVYDAFKALQKELS